MKDDRPFSRLQPVGSLPRTGIVVPLVADAEACAAIAAFLDLPSVEAFAATFEVAPSRGGTTRVTGEVKASVHQLCVSTSEPFPTAIVEEVDIRFAPEDRLGPVTAKEVERTLDDEDPPEPMVGNAIDLGALAVETLAVALDPFPRKPGAPPADVTYGDATLDDARENPFAALAALKKPSVDR